MCTALESLLASLPPVLKVPNKTQYGGATKKNRHWIEGHSGKMVRPTNLQIKDFLHSSACVSNHMWHDYTNRHCSGLKATLVKREITADELANQGPSSQFICFAPFSGISLQTFMYRTRQSNIIGRVCTSLCRNLLRIS